MYCQNCGSQVNVNLNYCNTCGAKLAKPTGDNSFKSLLGLLISAFGFIAVVGLGVLIPLLLILLDRGVAPQFIVVIAICYLAAVFGICSKLGSLISPLMSKITPEERKFGQAEYIEPSRLSKANTAQLEEAKFEPLSVTDNTTKTLDEVLLKRS